MPYLSVTEDEAEYLILCLEALEGEHAPPTVNWENLRDRIEEDS